MITNSNTFYYLFKNSIKTKDYNLLKEIVFNEIAKTVIYDKTNVLSLFDKNNIKYSNDDCVLDIMFNNLELLSNDISNLIVKRNNINDIDDKDFNILNTIVKNLEENDKALIKKKIISYKELLEKKYNIDDNNKNKKIKKNIKIFIISAIGVSLIIGYLYLKNKKINRLASKNKNKINKVKENYINNI